MTSETHDALVGHQRLGAYSNYSSGAFTKYLWYGAQYNEPGDFIIIVLCVEQNKQQTPHKDTVLRPTTTHCTFR
jgi:hypothetical protein